MQIRNPNPVITTVRDRAAAEEWRQFLDLLVEYDLQTFAKMECLRLFGHDRYDFIDKTFRASFIDGMKPMIAYAKSQAQAGHGSRRTDQ
ncbi:MAG: hypothetical protein AAGF59_06515 [Pseudomonadota bacterium]